MTGETHGTHNTFRVEGGAPAGGLVQGGHIENVHLTASAGPALPTPHQLPPGPARFVDRERELADFLRAIEHDTPDDGPFCVRITGLWGAGRTALAQRFARRWAAGRQPGESPPVLFLDLDDLRRDGACDFSEALSQLLAALGVPREWHGASHAERARQYWDATARRPGLALLLDNVRFGSEAAALLPASPGGLVVLVSRTRLYDLPDLPGVDIHVEPLPTRHAMDFLTGLLHDGDTRLAGEPEAAEGLVELCGGLPVLLRVVAHSLRRHQRRSVARLLEKLRADRLEGVPEMEAVWDQGYEALSAPGRRLYRALAAAPACELPQEAVVAALGEGADTGLDALEELEDAGLLEPGHERCVRMHTLVREHALRRAEPGEAEAVRARVVRWYRRQAALADRAAAGPRLVVAPEAARLPGAPDLAFEDAEAARAWLAAQRPALHACVRLAAGHGAAGGAGSADGDDAWALCEPLFTDYLDHPQVADTPEVFALGLDAARRAGHTPAIVRMNCQLARVHWDRGDFAAAERETAAAVAAAELLPGVVRGGGSAAPPDASTVDFNRKLRASALEFRGRAQAEQGEWERAIPDYEASLRVHEAIGNTYGAVLLTYLLGVSAAGLGRLDRAGELLTRAREKAAELGKGRMTARTGFALADVERRLGRHAEAEALYRASLTDARKRGSTFDEARVLDALAGLADTRGETARAAEYRERAREIGERALG